MRRKKEMNPEIREKGQKVCPHFGECGGCKFLHMTYEEELQMKDQEMRTLLQEGIREAEGYVEADVLDRIRRIEEWYEGILPSPRAFEYRNKMEFSFGDSCMNGPLALGMHKNGSFYDIVTVDHCRIVDEDYRRILRGTLDFFTERGTAFYHKRTHEGFLRHLLVRKALHTGEILVDLITTSALPDGLSLDEYKDMLLSLPLKGKFAGILHTINDDMADAIKDGGTEILYGESSFEETLLGLHFRISPFSFFQTNSYGAEVLYDTARKYLMEGIVKEEGEDKKRIGKVLYDLYSGTGTITQMMAPAADMAIGVEIIPEAVEAARENARRNGIENCRFLAGDVLQVLDAIAERPDVIILDPPRDGVHPKVLPRILQYGVDHILYIACKPKSFVRDLPAFLHAGYLPVRGCSVDEFPWTNNVEAIVLLSKLI